MKHQNDHYYLISIQYLGFRYHGWQKQPGVKTVQGMIEKTLSFILKDKPFKILGASRTDAMVSTEDTAFQLILREKIEESHFLNTFNENLPADIKATAISSMRDGFNIIQDVSAKTYYYFFAFGEKIHPFSAPYMAFVREALDINLMMQAAALFEGSHDFSAFCEKAAVEKSYHRTIDTCSIERNKDLKADFFPEKSYVLKISGKGFLRYQVRYIMGALFDVGSGKLKDEGITFALKNGGEKPITSKAPASGLILYETLFNKTPI